MRIYIALGVISFCFFVFSTAHGAKTVEAPPMTGDIKVSMFSFKDHHEGQVLLGVFSSQEHFKKRIATLGATLRISKDTLVYVFEHVPVGDYMIALLHDENFNGKMDQSLLLLPKEGYGFSQNKRGLLGPPSFAESKITVKANQVTTVPIIIRR